MSWGAALWWLPTAAVVAMTALGVVALAVQPWRPERKSWLAAVLAGGALAIGASAWQQVRSHVVLGAETARLQALGLRLDELGRMLPAGPGKTPGETFDTVAAGLVALNAKIKDLEGQIHTLQQKSQTRNIDPPVARKLADYLRGAGAHRAVVSCLPEDIEAFTYANQLANILREAGWEALGPEKTTIFGDEPAMGIKLYVRSGGGPPEAAQILIDAFTRFNVPYRSGVAPSEAIPDPATTELFVSRKP
jgi:hypothetical protein